MQALLDQIEEALLAHYPEVADSLLSPATEAELQALQQACLQGQELPEELRALYRWHNGQSGYGSFNQNDNRRWLPIAEVIAAWQFLNDPKADLLLPPEPEWLPLLYNGAGDYVMLAVGGADDGRLITYWHDDERRDDIYFSLEDWLEEVQAGAQPL